MAGDARTDNFMLSTATVMIGPQADLYKLTPETHSLGLVKNFTIDSKKDRTDLTQGRQGDLVFSMTTSSETNISCEVYEYTAQNLAYALSLDGSSYAEVTGSTRALVAASTYAAGIHTLNVGTAPGTYQALAVGNYVTLRNPANENILFGKLTEVSNLASGTIKVDVGNFDTPLPIGTVVSRVHVMNIGSTADDANFAAKVIGQLANGTWVTLLFPKVRISSGLNMAFQTDNYGNMPFEMRPLKVLQTDPFYNDFANLGKTQGKLLLDTAKSAVV